MGKWHAPAHDPVGNAREEVAERVDDLAAPADHHVAQVVFGSMQYRFRNRGGRIDRGWVLRFDIKIICGVLLVGRINCAGLDQRYGDGRFVLHQFHSQRFGVVEHGGFRGTVDTLDRNRSLRQCAAGIDQLAAMLAQVFTRDA